MTLHVTAEPTPIRIDAGGTARVGNTGVRLASIVYRHQQGDSPEQIQACFPDVSLPDVYEAVGYYLRHRAEIDAHLAADEAEADRLQAQLEATYPTTAL